MITNPIQIRRRTPLPVMATLLSLFLGPLAEARRQVPEAHHEQEPRLDVEVGAEARPNLGSIGADPREVRRIFVDGTT
jgi:hypothetical protein